MNYYERIQQAINFAEQNLENNIAVEDMAKQAYMSISNFYRLFFALAGFQAKEYLIKRRISSAAFDIKTTRQKVIDIALKYSYDSPDAFSRIFKKLTGCTPSSYKKENNNFIFERIDIMEKYFGDSDSEIDERYPEIKVIKNLKDMRVAYYCHYGRNPEEGAFLVIKNWMHELGLDINCRDYRIFGYNAADTDPSANEYGYEVCVTIPDDMDFNDEIVKTKVINGGLYAIVSIESSKDLGKEIIKGWERFFQWLDGSKYIYGKTQWMEEHLDFDNELEHCSEVELYLPVMPKSELEEIESAEENIEPFIAASYTAKGKGAENKAKNYIFQWAEKQKIDFNCSNTRVFATYNSERIGKPDFWYKMFVTIPEDMELNDPDIVTEKFMGGFYLRCDVKYCVNAQSWYHFIQTIISSKRYDFGCTPFLEEYLISAPYIGSDTDIAQHMPVKLKLI